MGLFIVGAAMGGRLASLDSIDLILQASWLVKLVLLIMATISVVSWAIIVFKWRELKGAAQDSDAFLEVYHDGSLDRSYDSARQLEGSPLARIFVAVYAEASRMARSTGRPIGRGGVDEAQLAVLAREITWSVARRDPTERGLSFLATAGSASPFIGLFGTVIGIMNAFTKSPPPATRAQTVAPAIAEALMPRLVSPPRSGDDSL